MLELGSRGTVKRATGVNSAARFTLVGGYVTETNKEEPKKIGRPTDFTLILAEKILARVGHGETLTAICSEDGMPGRTTVYRWSEEREEFRAAYVRARDWQMESWADEIQATAADESRDIQHDADGRPRSDNTAVNRDRLKIDTKKWLMARLNPKRYGDKVQQEITGKDGGALVATLEIVFGNENQSKT